MAAIILLRPSLVAIPSQTLIAISRLVAATVRKDNKNPRVRVGFSSFAFLGDSWVSVRLVCLSSYVIHDAGPAASPPVSSFAVIGVLAVLGRLCLVMAVLAHLIDGCKVTQSGIDTATSGSRPQLVTGDMGAGIKFLLGVGRLALNSYREDGKVVELHGIALEHKFLDTSHHIVQHTADYTFGVRGAMVRHVSGQFVKAHSAVEIHVGIPVALVLRIAAVVLIQFVLQHND